MIEIGEFMTIPPSVSLDGLMRENKILEQRNSNFAAYVVIGAVASTVLLICFIKAKQEAEKYKVRLADLENEAI